MKPFAQKQNQSGARWLGFVTVVAVGFGAWYFDLTPQLRPVPSGELANQELPDAPALPDSWDPIVDHTVDSPAEVDDHSDPLLRAIADDSDSSDKVFEDLSEPDVTPASAITDDASLPAGTVNDNQITPASFVAPPTIRGTQTTAASGVVNAIATSEANPVLSAEMAATLREIDSLLRQDNVVEAHFALSTLYWKEVEQRPVFLRRLESTAAKIFTDPHQHFSPPYLVQPGDTLESIGQQYSIPWQYLSRLNRIEPKELQAGQELKVMKGPFSAVVDLARFELTIHAHGYYVHRYPVGIGHADSTPVGEFQVQERLENPTWFGPNGEQVDADDPQNPLGEYWIGLGDHIGIHGTIDPDSIGTNRSRGCIHMRDNDIAEVFGLLGPGSSVRIRP
jgi:LysM repeat protein